MEYIDYSRFDIDKYLTWMRIKSKEFDGLTLEKAAEKESTLYDHITGDIREVYLPGLAEWLRLEEDIKERTEQKIQGIANNMEYSPLPKEEFIRREIEAMEKDLAIPVYQEFYKSCVRVDYLPKNKHIKYPRTHFMWYVAYIKTYQYLHTQLQQCEILSGNGTGKIKWQGAQIELITILFDMLEYDLIKASKADITRVLVNNFTDKDGKNLSYSYVYERLKPEAEKSKGRVNFNELI